MDEGAARTTLSALRPHGTQGAVLRLPSSRCSQALEHGTLMQSHPVPWTLPNPLLLRHCSSLSLFNIILHCGLIVQRNATFEIKQQQRLERASLKAACITCGYSRLPATHHCARLPEAACGWGGRANGWDFYPGLKPQLQWLDLSLCGACCG